NEYPNWETKKLDNMLSERNYKQVPEKDVPLMAFTSTGGIEDKGERYNREFLVKNKNKKYKRTEFNDLIYSSNNLDVRAIGLNRYDTSVRSYGYEIFVVKENTSPQYIEMAITQPKFMYKILKCRQGALYGQFKIHPRVFLNIDIELPSTKEQDKIGSFINKMNILINKQKNKIELLKNVNKDYYKRCLYNSYNDLLCKENKPRSRLVFLFLETSENEFLLVLIIRVTIAGEASYP